MAASSEGRLHEAPRGISGVFRNGCGATRTWSSSWNGCGSSIGHCTRDRPSNFTGWISTACSRPSKPSSAIWRELIPPPHNFGFTTYAGSVAAASDWGEPVELKRVRPALPESCEALFHAVHPTDFVLNLRDPQLRGPLATNRLERAIGVIYRPQTERHSTIFSRSLPCSSMQ
jgi:hypothetical protein